MFETYFPSFTNHSHEYTTDISLKKNLKKILLSSFCEIIFILRMICSIRIEIKLKYVVLEVTRPGKDRFSVREWGFKLFPYPVPSI